jgi:acylphosphatase
MKIRVHVFISGMVQGVFFRSETRNQASKHDVAGWVRNLPDERVEAVLEGEEENVKRLVEFCRKGPRGARVASLDATWETYTGEFESFEIRY